MLDTPTALPPTRSINITAFRLAIALVAIHMKAKKGHPGSTLSGSGIDLNYEYVTELKIIKFM
jgi:hypothetical protein